MLCQNNVTESWSCNRFTRKSCFSRDLKTFGSYSNWNKFTTEKRTIFSEQQKYLKKYLLKAETIQKPWVHLSRTLTAVGSVVFILAIPLKRIKLVFTFFVSWEWNKRVNNSTYKGALFMFSLRLTRGAITLLYVCWRRHYDGNLDVRVTLMCLRTC